MVDVITPEADCPAPPAKARRSKKPKVSRSEILRNAVDRLAKRTHLAATSEDANVIHRVRVATRKLGTALRSYEPLVSNKTQQKIRKALKKIRRLGGAVRDIDVAVECLDDLGKGLSSDALLTVLYYRGRLEEQRNLAQKKFQTRCQKIDNQGFWDWCQRHLKADVRKNSRASTTRQNLVIKGLIDAYQKVCEFREKHLSDPSDIELLHDLRKALKAFRYTLDMVPPRQLPARIIKRADAIAQEAQDRLGKVIDVENTLQMISHLRSEQPANKGLLEKNRDLVLSALNEAIARCHLSLAEGWKRDLDLGFLEKPLKDAKIRNQKTRATPLNGTAPQMTAH